MKTVLADRHAKTYGANTEWSGRRIVLCHHIATARLIRNVGHTRESQAMGIFKGWGAKFAEAGNTDAAKLYDDFENGVGTYLKVIQFPEPSNPDAFVTLYLRSTGLFLLLGYWPGYERSAAAGTWSKQDDAISLDGCGETSTDAPPDRGGLFQRVLETGMQNSTPLLLAAGEMKGWSLLGWPGPFTYIGQSTVIDPDGEWLPHSLEDVDTWIEKLIGV